MNQPLVLEIKGNSLDDGPGIRSAVFFKGCPLSCIWCHNPESKRVPVELSYDIQSCIGCGTCVETCTKKALSKDNLYFVNRDLCDLCFENPEPGRTFCIDVCPAKALTRVGQKMSYEEILKRLLSDKTFYDVSGGGVTLTGGEATLCTEWVGGLAKALKEAGVNVLLETCGFFEYYKVKEFILPYVKDIYCDIKIFDREAHKKYCGVYNDKIIENIRQMQADQEKFGYSLMLRVPLIPGITDTDENLSAIADFMSEIGVEKTDLLPYNPTWYSKNDKLGVKLAGELEGLNSWQDKETVEHAKSFFRAKNIEC